MRYSVLLEQITQARVVVEAPDIMEALKEAVRVQRNEIITFNMKGEVYAKDADECE